MGRSYLLGLTAFTTMSVMPVLASPVNFWLSNSMNGPEVPTIEVLANSVNTLDVWASPAMGLKLLGFSLNLVAEQPGAITFQEVEVHNPSLISSPGSNRHQYIFDSSSDMFDEFHLQNNEIDSFFGVSLFDNLPGLPDGGGIGPDCDDAECIDLGDSTIWRIATVTFQAGAALNSTQLFLEIGEHGLWHAEEEPTDTSAIFGVNDVEHEWHTPMNPGPDSRGMHFGLPDAVINVVSVLADADFDGDGAVDGRDFLIWQRGVGIGTKQSQGDANFDEGVDGDDLAVWQAQYGGAVMTPSVVAVPEPASLALLMVVFFSGFLRTRSRRSPF